jgi:hypothetical protein
METMSNAIEEATAEASTANATTSESPEHTASTSDNPEQELEALSTPSVPGPPEPTGGVSTVDEQSTHEAIVPLFDATNQDFTNPSSIPNGNFEGCEDFDPATMLDPSYWYSAGLDETKYMTPDLYPFQIPTRETHGVEVRSLCFPSPSHITSESFQIQLRGRQRVLAAALAGDIVYEEQVREHVEAAMREPTILCSIIQRKHPDILSKDILRPNAPGWRKCRCTPLHFHADDADS